jgi:hypothetical protein
MKILDHPNIVNLIEVIDDLNTYHFYMGIPFGRMRSRVWVMEKKMLKE